METKSLVSDWSRIRQNVCPGDVTESLNSGSTTQFSEVSPTDVKEDRCREDRVGDSPTNERKGTFSGPVW